MVCEGLRFPPFIDFTAAEAFLSTGSVCCFVYSIVSTVCAVSTLFSDCIYLEMMLKVDFLILYPDVSFTHAIEGSTNATVAETSRMHH